jgi:hypothetical protein
MPINKQHKEFYAVDMGGEWEVPEGYPEGIKQKILVGHLDEVNKTGGRTPAQIRARRLHDSPFHPRLLGRSLPAQGRPDRRQ